MVLDLFDADHVGPQRALMRRAEAGPGPRI